MRSLRATLPISLTLAGCATYQLPPAELFNQFANSGEEVKKTVIIAPPYVYFPTAVSGNNLRSVRVYDASGTLVTLPVTSKTSVRFTKTDGTKTTFYFDTLLLQDSAVTGSKTHFFNLPIKPIPFRDIVKVELQKH